MKFNHKIQIHGHRGARGLYSENSLEGFLKTLDLGVDALELDVVITKDKKIIVSHEPWINPLLCVNADKSELASFTEFNYNIYEMNYEDVAKFICGYKLDNYFTSQKTIQHSKPLLTEVITSVEEKIKKKSIHSIIYNIEIKSSVEGDHLFHPKPKDYSELVYNTIRDSNILDKVIIQSFDSRILEEINKLNSSVPLGLLVEDTNDHEINLAKLNFMPKYYNPDYTLVSKELISYLHSKKIKILAWTVNKPETMRELIDWGVDGIITDYPNLLNELLNQNLRN